MKNGQMYKEMIFEWIKESVIKGEIMKYEKNDQRKIEKKEWMKERNWKRKHICDKNDKSIEIWRTEEESEKEGRWNFFFYKGM